MVRNGVFYAMPSDSFFNLDAYHKELSRWMGQTDTLMWLLIVGAVVTLVAAYRLSQASKISWGPPEYLAKIVAGMSVVFAVGALSTAVIYAWQSTVSVCRCGGGSMTKEFQFATAAYETLGDHIGVTFPGKTVVVISNGDASPRMVQRHADLVSGIAGRASIVTVSTDSPEADEMLVSTYDLSAAEFEGLLVEHVPGYADPTGGDPRDVAVVSLIGLPVDSRAIPLWSRAPEARPHLILANAYLVGLAPRIQAGQIDAVLSHRPDAVYDPDLTVPATRAARFDLRYLLITPETIDDSIVQYPGIYGLDQMTAAQ